LCVCDVSVNVKAQNAKIVLDAYVRVTPFFAAWKAGAKKLAAQKTVLTVTTKDRHDNRPDLLLINRERKPRIVN